MNTWKERMNDRWMNKCVVCWLVVNTNWQMSERKMDKSVEGRSE